MYLGTTKKRNGSYSPQFSAKPKKNWAYWVELTAHEESKVKQIQQAIKQAELAGNLPEKLKLLARVNEIKSQIEHDNEVSFAVRESALDLY